MTWIMGYQSFMEQTPWELQCVFFIWDSRDNHFWIQGPKEVQIKQQHSVQIPISLPYDVQHRKYDGLTSWCKFHSEEHTVQNAGSVPDRWTKISTSYLILQSVRYRKTKTMNTTTIKNEKQQKIRKNIEQNELNQNKKNDMKFKILTCLRKTTTDCMWDMKGSIKGSSFTNSFNKYQTSKQINNIKRKRKQPQITYYFTK